MCIRWSMGIFRNTCEKQKKGKCHVMKNAALNGKSSAGNPRVRLCGGLLACLCASAAFAAVDVAEYNHVIHPGTADGAGFWNVRAKWFMYAPAFGFEKVGGAVKYRFTVLDDWHEKQVFEADEPTAALTPVWPKVRVGYTTVRCEGLSAAGAVVGLAGERTFWKAAGFDAAKYKPAARGYAETARRVYAYVFDMKETKYLLEHGKPDASYELNTYVSKMFAALIRGMIGYSKLEPAKKDVALKVAFAAADHLIAKSEPAGAPLAYFPPTYDGRGEKDNGYIAEKFKGQVMLIYPASVAGAFVALYKATGVEKYLEHAKKIAETYLKLQDKDGTWYLKIWAKDGKPVTPNRLVPIATVIPMFEGLFDLTGDTRYRVAADRAFRSVEGRLQDWNWEGQFEDVVPKERYRNLTKHDACATAIYFGSRFPGDKVRQEQMRELLRFSEDQFVCWEAPYLHGRGNYSDWNNYDTWCTPCALEQYNCYVPIDASAAKLIRTYLALYKAQGNPADLAKARALGDTATRMQCPDGRLPTWWWPDRAKRVYADWINCMMATAEALEQLAAETETK